MSLDAVTRLATRGMEQKGKGVVNVKGLAKLCRFAVKLFSRTPHRSLHSIPHVVSVNLNETKNGDCHCW
jgi:hypothetical protein